MKRFISSVVFASLAFAACTGQFKHTGRGRLFVCSDEISLREAFAQAEDGDRIVLKKGSYYLAEPLSLCGARDISIEGESGAVLSGGIEIPRGKFRKIKADERRELGLRPEVRALDISDLPNVQAPFAAGFLHELQASWTQMFYDGRPMELSCWPEEGYAFTDSVICSGINRTVTYDSTNLGVIRFKEDRPLEWRHPERGVMRGYFKWGWGEEFLRIAAIGSDKSLACADTSTYGFDCGKFYIRWRILNMPEELRAPLEYAIDTQEGRIYAILPRGTKRPVIGTNTTALLDISKCKNISISGLSFMYGRGDAIRLKACDSVVLDLCEISNMGRCALCIDADSKHCGIKNSKIHHISSGGVVLDGGNRRTLERGDNYVEDCELYEFNYLLSSYRPGVKFFGVGNRVSGCKLYASDAQAIHINGNDHIIENCDISDVCRTIEDNGAIYFGRDATERGLVIRNNYFHDIVTTHNIRAVYHDDGACGAEVYGNIFNNITSAPVQIGGGSDIHYHDNIFMNLPKTALKSDARLQTWALEFYYIIKDLADEMDSPLFREHYPEWASYYEGDIAVPRRNVLERNVFYNVNKVFERVIWDEHDFNDIISGEANFFSVMKDNWISEGNPGFIDINDPSKGFAEHPALLDAIPEFRLPEIKK